MGSYGFMAIGRSVKIGIDVMMDYPIMCAKTCRHHEDTEAYCQLFQKVLIKIEDRYARCADCIRSEVNT
jgi:hypothetical protein